MAHKTEKEETEFKVVSETLTLCINNCGFTGTPATNNMCQKCFTASSSSSSSSTASGIISAAAAHMFSSTEKTVRSTSSTTTAHTTAIRLTSSHHVEVPDRKAKVVLEAATTTMFKKEVNRCSGCRKRVGLTGFRCRCGDLFCSEHRYSDRHDCSYDYKAAGREAIERENPVVKAAKIVRL